MGKRKRLIIISCVFLFLVVIAVVLFLILNNPFGKSSTRSSERPFEIISTEECMANEEECISVEYNKDFNCDEAFTKEEYEICIEIYSYFNETIDLCEDVRRLADNKTITDCMAFSNYCPDKKDEDFKFYKKMINMPRYLTVCKK